MTSIKTRLNLYNIALWIVLIFVGLSHGATASDDFAGTGATSASWTVIRSGLNRASGHLVSTSSFGIIQRNNITPGAAQYSEGVVGIDAANIFNGQSYLFLRMVDIDNYYAANLDDLRHSIIIIRRIAGVNATIYTVSAPASIVAGDTIKMSVDAAYTFTLSRNGTSFGSFDDITLGTLSSGGVGIGGAGLATDQGEWDYWEGGDVGGGCTAPTVTVDPSNTSVTEPTTANFTATVTGTTPTYQWQRGSTNVSTGSGGTTLSYTTAATTVAGDNGATFRLIAHNSCGDDTSANATLTVTAAPSSPLPFSTNLDSETPSCWNSRPDNANQEHLGTCGSIPFQDFGIDSATGFTGDSTMRLGSWGVAHSGAQSVRLKYRHDEDASRFRVYGLNNGHIFVRQWRYIVGPYDHAFGEKIFRMDALDTVNGGAFYEPICFMRSATQTSGTDLMASLTCEPNGGSSNFGTATITFPNNTWFELAFEFKINSTGGSDGICKMWFNDSLISSQTSLSNMRTSSHGFGYNSATDNHNITMLSFGGWRSDAGRDPNPTNVQYVDDVCADTAAFTASCSTLVGGGGTPPTITVNPSNATVTAPATAAFSVTATGDATLLYQWYKNSVLIGGATSASYTTAATTYSDNGATYYCIVTNSSGTATSSSATLTVNSKPVRTSGPSNLIRIVGQTGLFTVTYTGTATITYQWQKGTTNVSTGSGGTTASYTTAALVLGDNGNTYRVIATNSYGADTSSAATLTVTAHANRCGPRRKIGIGAN